MREDMFKVIVERPRHGSRARTHGRGRLAGEDDLPVKIGLRRHIAVTGQKTKWLNENLNPLRRYLGRQVGRRWNDVFSEIAATLAPGHTVKEHVRQHLDDFVARKVVVDEDGNWESLTRRRRFLRQGLPWYEDFYVDPRDGVLKDSAVLWKTLGLDPWRRRWRPPEPDPNVRPLAPMCELRRIAGIWYEIGYDREPGGLATVFDLVQHKLVPIGQRHAVSKRQLSRSELIDFGIANEELH